MLTLNLQQLNQDLWRAFYLHAKQGSRHELLAVTPSHSSPPIYLRRGTSDIDNLAQIYIKKEYGFLPLKPRTMLDLGGYIGLASCYISMTYPETKIFLVEPDPDNYALALLNTRPYPNIQCLNAGAWSRSCRLAIAGKVGGDWGTMVRELGDDERNDVAIQAWTVSELMTAAGFDTVDFLKVDIEGSEKAIFAESGSAQWIDRCNMISCELHDRMVPGCSEAVSQALGGSDFDHGQHGEFDYYLRRTPLTVDANA